MSLSDAELDERMVIAMAAAAAAGRHLMELFETDLTVETKSSEADLVTRADREAEAIVLSHLREGAPNDAIVAEESGQVQGGSGPCWYVDPLDGTTNYAHRFPHFCVSIALFDGETGLIGVVHEPTRNETFMARKGAGAWLHRPGEIPRPLRVTDTAQLSKSLLATGFGYDRPRGGNVAEFGRLVRQVHGVRRAGSAALDLAYVAAGRVDGYWEYELQPWDWGAGAVLVREAGGQVETMHGEPWKLRGPSVCASGPALLGALQAALADPT